MTAELRDALVLADTAALLLVGRDAGLGKRLSVEGLLMEAEPHALVISAEGEPTEARFFGAGIVGMAAELADGDDGGVDVRDREEEVDAAVRILVMDTAADRRGLDPRLVAIAHRVEGPLQQLAVEGLGTLRVGNADLEEGWFATH